MNKVQLQKKLSKPNTLTTTHPKNNLKVDKTKSKKVLREKKSPTHANLLEPIQCLLHENQYPVSPHEIYQLAEKSVDGEIILREDLSRIFSQLNIQTQWQKVMWKNLDRIEFPAMLMLKDGKAVTLLSLHTDYAVVSVVKNSQVKVTKIQLNSLKKMYSGELLLVGAAQVETTSNRIRISEWMSGRTLTVAIIEIILASLMVNLFQLALPLYTMNVYDKVLPNQAEETLWVLFSGIIIILVLDYVFRLMRSMILENLSEKVGEALMMRLLRKSATVNSSDKEDVGAISDTFHEINNYRVGFFSKTLLELIEFPFFFLFFAVIYAISPEVAMVPFYAAIFIVIVNLLHQFPIKSLSKDLYPLNKKKESFLVQLLSGRESLRLSNGFSRFINQWQAKMRQILGLSRASQLWNASMMTTLPILVQLVSAVVVFIGAYQIFTGELTIGEMIALTLLSARAILPVLNFSSALTRLFSSRHMLSAWRKLLTRETDYDVTDNIVSKTQFKGGMVLKDVRFKYPNMDSFTLQGINIQIKAGERIGIVGPSGAGKSTLLRVMSNLEKVEQGEVQLDGFSIRDIHPFEFHRNVAYMPQNPAFFSGSVYDNIRMAGQHNNQQTIEKMVEFFALNSLMMQKTIGGGLSFQVGEGGSNLSGGQRQLVAFMRSMCHDSVIHMLDEPTSGMDGSLENQVINYLSQHTQGKTLILVTHRPGLLTLIDKLIVMNEGKIVDIGNKEAMIQKYFNTASQEKNVYVPTPPVLHASSSSDLSVTHTSLMN